MLISYCYFFVDAHGTLNAELEAKLQKTDVPADTSCIICQGRAEKYLYRLSAFVQRLCFWLYPNFSQLGALRSKKTCGFGVVVLGRSHRYS